MGAKLFKPLFGVDFVMVGGDGTFAGDEFHLPLNSSHCKNAHCSGYLPFFAFLLMQWGNS